MTNLLSLVGNYILSGVPSNAAWDGIKLAWEKVNERSWEQLYLDAFEQTVETERSRLEKYATADSDILIDRSYLSNVLHYELGAAIPTMTLANLTNEEFGRAVANALVRNEVLVIGGHNLSEEDYTSLILALVRKSTELFKRSILTRRGAFREAVLYQLLENAELAYETLEFLENRFDVVLQRLDEHAAKMDKIYDKTELIENLLHRVVEKHEWILPSAIPSPDNRPLAPLEYVQREFLLSTLLANMTSATFIALVDGPGKGKTQLAREILASKEKAAGWWISLDIEDSSSSVHLREQVVRWLVEATDDDAYWSLFLQGRMSLDQITRSLLTVVDDEALLVLDDLPNPDLAATLYRDLYSLVMLFDSMGGKIVATSLWPLPLDIRLLNATLVRGVPNFINEEIRNLLLSLGAPKEMTEIGVIALILANTDGNAALVSATVNWLKRKKWNLDNAALMELISGKPLEEVRRYRRIRLLRLLDDEPRGLLHRLTLIEDVFDRALALDVAAVQPSLSYSGDAFDQLTYPWLESLENDNYRVSPLLKGTGKENLAVETQQDIHLTIVDYLLGAGSISVDQISKIASHLWVASQYERYASFIVQAILSVSTPEDAKYLDEVTALSYFIAPGSAWPEAMNLDSRIMFRAAQVRLRMLAGMKYDEIYSDLEELLADAGSDQAASVFFALVYTGALLGSNLPTEETVSAVRKAIQAIRLLKQTEIFPYDEIEYESLIWLPVWSMDNAGQLQQFLHELGQLSNAERSALFDSTISMESTDHVVGKRWMIEADKPESERDWNQVLSYYDDVRRLAKEYDLVILDVFQARSRAIVQADYLKQGAKSLNSLANLPSLEGCPELKFIIHYTQGSILQDNNKPQEALEQFENALAIHDEKSPYYLFDTSRRYTILLSRLKRWEEALSSCKQTIHLASMLSADYGRLEMMGEMAWIHWSAGNPKKAFGALYGYVNGVVSLKDLSNPRYREAYNKVGHGLGWIVSMAKIGRGPTLTRNGDPYTPVEPGIFGLPRSQLQEIEPQYGFSSSDLLIMLALLADAVGLPHTAWGVYKKASRLEEEPRDSVIMGLSKSEFAALTARFGEISKSLKLAARAIREAITSQSLSVIEPISFEDLGTEVDEKWGKLSETERMQHERALIQLVFAPAFAETLGSISDQNKLEARAASWKSAITDYSEKFEEPRFWYDVVAFLNQLVTKSDQEFPKVDDVPGKHTLLMVFWYLVSSTTKGVRLSDSLSMQVSAIIPFVEHPTIGKNMYEGIGRYLYRFWSEVAAKRRFAINSPDIFQKDLLDIKSSEGAKTIVEVLLCASVAVSTRLPNDVITKLRQLASHHNLAASPRTA